NLCPAFPRCLSNMGRAGTAARRIAAGTRDRARGRQTLSKEHAFTPALRSNAASGIGQRAGGARPADTLWRRRARSGNAGTVGAVLKRCLGALRTKKSSAGGAA